MYAQQYIDSLDFARNGLETQGKILAADLPRLQSMLAAPEGEFTYLVRGRCSSLGEPLLQVTLEGSCQLICQRCLQSLAYPVKLVAQLLLVTADQVDQVVDDSEDYDTILANKHMDVLSLLEEELLLSLPFAPTHPPGDCSSEIVLDASKETERTVKHPFAVLAELKSRPN